jgi:2-dehydropantoate 2-reductase
MMRLAIYGSGAVGSFFGAKLSQAGHEVIFIARGAQLEALRSTGLRVEGVDDIFMLSNVRATDNPASIGLVDFVFLAVKTWQVASILPHLGSLLHSESRVLTLQNGVETAGIVAAQIDADRVLTGVVRGFFFMDAPGLVRHLGVQPSIIFGPSTHEADPVAARLCDVLQATGGIYAEIPANIDVALWEKFLLVTAVSGVGALTRQPIGAIRNYAPAYQMLADSMREIYALALARQIPLPADTVERTLDFVASFPPDATASMQRDIMEGRPSELEAQTGAVVRLAAQSGVDVPVNRLVYHSLYLQEAAGRSRN